MLPQIRDRLNRDGRRLFFWCALILVGGGFAFWLAFRFFGVDALLINTVVDEPIDTFLRDKSSVSEGVAATSTDLGVSAMALPADRSGLFQQGDSTYRIRGTATIAHREDGPTLVLSDFDVTNGPDLFLYLVAATSTENAQVKRQVGLGAFIKIAPLKGNRGNQAYRLSPDIDLSAYSVVSVWCRRFSRNFGAALLQE